MVPEQGDEMTLFNHRDASAKPLAPSMDQTIDFRIPITARGRFR